MKSNSYLKIRKFLNNRNVIVPILHPFIKLHKENHPIQSPLIHFKIAPSYNLATF